MKPYTAVLIGPLATKPFLMETSKLLNFIPYHKQKLQNM